MYQFTNLLAFALGTPEIIMIVVLVLLLFGGAKIPQLMRGLGKGVSEFHKGIDEGKRSFSSVKDSTIEHTDASTESSEATKA